MTTRLVFIRHAETVWNHEQRVQGFLDSPLTEKGRRQAEALGRRLKKIPATAAFTGTHGRSVETARRALEGTKIPLALLQDLRERNLGQWEGRVWPEVVAQDPIGTHSYRTDPNFRPPDGESWLELQRRAFGVVERLIAEHPGETLFVFTSGGPVRAAVMAAMNAAPESWWGWSTANAGISILDHRDEGWRVQCYNDTNHLDS